ncbi:uncharacterized protein LOC111392422 [Olea europaea var. sylvestris]|uniref:uncharacterized protein LOC111392422 n=1 Tax=Olea europaea var. sylvestris TaxID=158386 RepID=UPI000C1D0EE2|nr:uncharacterized protein LOC111392422 [Olea europaea var. sylvestris]
MHLIVVTMLFLFLHERNQWLYRAKANINFTSTPIQDLIHVAIRHFSFLLFVKPISFQTPHLSKMAESIAFLVCLAIAIMDITAGIMGIQAEIEQHKVQHLRAWNFECREPDNHAFKHGITAIVLLLMAHVIANLLGRCICIRSKEELYHASPSKQLASASLILSWYLCQKATSDEASFNQTINVQYYSPKI